MRDDIIYLDHNSTTPIDPRVLDAMMPYLTYQYGNASSNHKFGNEANQAVKKASLQIAELINCQPNELVYTSGATESINLALKGVAESYENKGNHIITVQTEHRAVLDVCKFLETKGFEVTYLPVQSNGLIRIEDLKATIRNTTILIAVMISNNETGVIQPIQEIAKIAQNANTLFFSDATQAFGKIPVDVDTMGIDLMAFSGHKIYGPKGVGGLFIKNRRKNRVKLKNQIHGGGHQNGKRSGTLNVTGIVGLGQAAEVSKIDMETDKSRVNALKELLEFKLLKIPGTFINGDLYSRLYNTCNFRFKNVNADALILKLENIIVSTGSACSSLEINPSHVLMAMGLSEHEAYSSLRIGLGRNTTENDINVAVNFIESAIKSLRTMDNVAMSDQT